MINYTNNFCTVIEKAKKTSISFKLNYVGTEEVVYAILRTPNCNACRYLNEFGATVENYHAYLKKTFKSVGVSGFTAKLNSAFKIANEIANSFKLSYVSTEHLLLAILTLEDCVAMSILRAIGVDVAKLYSKVLENLKKPKTERQNQSVDTQTKQIKPQPIKPKTCSYSQETEEKIIEKDYSVLEKVGYNLTEKAKSGKIDPVIGRESEIDRVIQTLSRKSKSNPLLIGEAGVGKSAVVEGLALRIAEGKVPEFLKEKVIFSLDLGGLLAGTRFRGDFEERIKSAIDFAISDGNVIFFIDEIHNLIGAGSTQDSNLDAAEILKPLLARGEVLVVGATTLDEYTKYIEKDTALERRFQTIRVEEPSVDTCIEILTGLKPVYEAHHKIHITDEAIKSAVILSKRYITDRFLPDKAIDLIDEAASKKRVQTTSIPKLLRELEEQIKKLTAERDYLLDEGSINSAGKIDKKIFELKKQLENEKINLYNKRSANNDEITEEDIKELITTWTKIPVTSLSTKESDKLMSLEDELMKRVIGQEDAIITVSKAVRRARANLKDPDKPMGSFIFVGPTGVGKSELTKALAECVFGSKDALIRFDMSEYQDKTSVNKLIGSAPGYVGYEEEGLLTDKIRKKPYSVVLFDEIEKANSDIFDLLLQVLDEGRLTDSKGRVVSFKNSLIILTSNLGFSGEESNLSFGFGASENADKDKIEKSLKSRFKPEFINRLDDIIVFNKLTEDNCYDIADIIVNNLIKRLKNQGSFLTVENSAMDVIVKQGYSKTYGARPIKRAVSRLIEDLLSDAIIEGEIKKGDKIVVYAEDEIIKYKKV